MSFSASAPRIEPQDLARELESLSEQQVEEANRDFYGSTGDAAIAAAETPQGCLEALCQLNATLSRIDEREHFNTATKRCPNYVNSDEFRLMFLRSENFDAERAASRLVYYWKEKVSIFGAEKAFRRLTIGDLEREEVAVIEAGGMVPLSGRDKNGRGLVLSDRTKWITDNRNSMARVAFYVMHSLLEDVDVQRTGIVILATYPSFFSVGDHDRKTHNKVILCFRKVLPAHIMAIHFIVKSPIAHLAMPYILHALGPFLRTRFKLHGGSDYDIASALSKYGIPQAELPFWQAPLVDHVVPPAPPPLLGKENNLA